MVPTVLRTVPDPHHAQETRQALGLRVEGNVVIVDEAHNLADAINASHSAELTAAQVRQRVPLHHRGWGLGRGSWLLPSDATLPYRLQPRCTHGSERERGERVWARQASPELWRAGSRGRVSWSHRDTLFRAGKPRRGNTIPHFVP